MIRTSEEKSKELIKRTRQVKQLYEQLQKYRELLKEEKKRTTPEPPPPVPKEPRQPNPIKQKSYRKKLYKYKIFCEEHVREKRLLQKELTILKKQYAHLNPDPEYHRRTTLATQLELICRTIVAYGKLVKDGIVNYHEFIFLIFGSQVEFFTMEDLKERYKDSLRHRYHVDLKDCVNAGYFEKLHRQKQYYLTQRGKDRINDILTHIYSEPKVGYARAYIRKFKNDNSE